MPDESIQIRRYPNRRFYARSSKKYVTIGELEEMVRQGHTIEVRDSQSGEDLTRTVLAQIILERQPEKVALFPTPMLHFIVRSNEMMSQFLRGYFRDSLTYLEYLQKHGAAAPFSQPMHWMQAWLSGISPGRQFGGPAAASAPPEDEDRRQLADRVEELEARIRQLEGTPREQ